MILANIFLFINYILNNLCRFNPIKLVAWLIILFGCLFDKLRTPAFVDKIKYLFIIFLAKILMKLGVREVKISVVYLLNFFRLIRSCLWLVSIVFALLISASVVILILILQIFPFIYQKILLLFWPPSADKFHSFENRFNTLILEIKTDAGIINKGRFIDLSFELDEALTLTISDVLQYFPNSDNRLNTPGKRSLYVFPRSKSLVTISNHAIKDYNLWYLPFNPDELDDFTVESIDQLESQIWHLKLYLKSNKIYFDFSEDWSFFLSPKLAPNFFLRLLKLLEETYYPKKWTEFFIFKRKLRGLLKKFRPILIKYAWNSRREYLNMLKEDKEAGIYVDWRSVRKEFKRLNNLCK